MTKQEDLRAARRDRYLARKPRIKLFTGNKIVPKGAPDAKWVCFGAIMARDPAGFTTAFCLAATPREAYQYWLSKSLTAYRMNSY